MMNIFDIASNDQSLYYLGKIFGNIGGVLPVNNGPLAVGLMFKVLNTAALSVGAMIVVYTTVMGLLSTASEGEFLGKKWSGLWVPVRTVLGIVGLFPSSGGYCAIQVIIMWLILQGVGLADVLWTSILTMMEKNGDSVYVTVPFPPIKQMVLPAMQGLFQGLVCYETLAFKPDPKDANPYNYVCTKDPSNAKCGKALPEFILGNNPNGENSDSNTKQYTLSDCGYLSVCDVGVTCKADPKSMTCLFCQAQNQALPMIIATLDSVAKKFVQSDYEYQKFFLTSNQTNITQTPQWIQDFCTDKKLKCCVWRLPSAPVSLGIFGTLITPPQPDNTFCSGNTFVKTYPIGAPADDSAPGSAADTGSSAKAVVEQLYDTFGIGPVTDNINFIIASANQYVSVLSQAYTTYLAASTSALSGGASKKKGTLSEWREESRNNGWILAGMYYYQITRGNAANTVKMDNLPSLNYFNLPAVSSANVKNVRNNITASAQLIAKITARDQASSFTSTPGLSGVSQTASMGSMVSSFMSDVTGLNEHPTLGQGDRVVGQAATNPLYRISVYGYNLIWLTQLLFWITVAISALAAGLSSVNFMGFGSGFTTNPWYEAFKTMMGMIAPFWALGLSALFSVGVMLGVYVPFIPYTIFTMGVIGWMMATIEAMVAGPIIALGILSPSGQHELLGKSEPAVMIIFNLVLRPSLMIFGLIASLFLSVAAVTLVNQTFLKVASDVITSPAIVESILMMMMYTSLILMVLNKVFSLIHVVPERVLTYIGGQAISYGESEGMGAMKQAMEGGASGMSGAAKEAGGGVGAGIQKVKEGVEHEGSAEVKAKKAGLKAGAGGAPPPPPPPLNSGGVAG